MHTHVYRYIKSRLCELEYVCMQEVDVCVCACVIACVCLRVWRETESLTSHTLTRTNACTGAGGHAGRLDGDGQLHRGAAHVDGVGGKGTDACEGCGCVYCMLYVSRLDVKISQNDKALNTCACLHK